MADLVGIAAKMKVLSDAYIAQLPEKFTQLEQAWQQLPRDAWDEAGFDSFRRMVHSLSGSGATFGLPALSKLAHELEEYLDSLAQLKVAPNTEQRDHIENLIHEFRRVT